MPGVKVLNTAEEERGEENYDKIWGSSEVPPLQPLFSHRVEGAGITASAYKHLGNEAPAVLDSNHADLSISPMHYSPHTAILPPSAPGKDWFHFLFICFSSPPSFTSYEAECVLVGLPMIDGAQ